MSYTIPDELYDLAFRYKQSKLWNKLNDQFHFFAVSHAGGEDSWCLALGTNGGAKGLEVCIGKYGFNNESSFFDDELTFGDVDLLEEELSVDSVSLIFCNKDSLERDELEDIQRYCRKNGRVLRGAGAYPKFLRLKPFCFPWRITEEDDLNRLRVALEAALEVAEQLKDKKPSEIGFGSIESDISPRLRKHRGKFVWESAQQPWDDAPEIYPECLMPDEFTGMRLQRASRTRKKWGVDVFLSLYPEIPENGEAPFFPFFMVVLDDETRKVIGHCLSEAGCDYTRQLPFELVNMIAEYGCPREIIYTRERTAALLGPLCAQAGIRLSCDPDHEFLNRFIDMYETHFASDEDGADSTEEEITEEEVIEMLTDPEFMSSISDRMLKDFEPMLENDAVPAEVKASIKRELKRRGR